MKKKIYQPMGLIPFITIAMLFFSIGSVFANPVKVVILPFQINAEKNLDFLKTGIQDMLSSRLSWKDKVVVMDKTAVNETVKSLGDFKGESLALLAGGQLKADYIISGSVTIIGQGASIDATLREITGKIEPISFFGQTNSLGGVIPEINRFATDINEQVFQHRTSSSLANTSQNTLAAPPAINTTTPNHLLKSASSGGTESVINPNFETTAPRGSNSGFWKSPPLPLRITGMDVGDVNNDGILETVVLTEDAIIIYQMVNNRMVKATEIPTSTLSHPLGVDIGDINGNGTPEIFISSLAPERNRANSYVLEFNGRSYPAITTNTSWYYRISKKNSGKLILLGQEQRKRDADIYTAPVYEMEYQNDEYVPLRKILKGKTANVLGMAVGGLTPKTPTIMATLDRAEHIALFTETGNLTWRNREPSGGNMSIFFLPKDQADDDQEIQFFPLRIRIHDIEGDGFPEILSATNHDNTIGFLSNSRSYDWGILESRSWKGTEMILNWKTSRLPGRISDFVVADFDNDGIDELVAATVTEEGTTVMSQSRSRLVAYDLMVPQGN